MDNDGDGKIDEDKDGGFSEPETQAIELLMNRLDSDGNHHNMRSGVGISIAYHSVGGWVIWPWGFTYNDAPHEELIVHIGHELMDQTGYTSWWDDSMYLTSGDSDDFLYGAHGTLAYTIELNHEDGAGFHPDPVLIINTSRRLLTSNLYATEMTGVAKIARDLHLPDLDIGLPVINHEQKDKVISNTESYKVKIEVENAENLDPNSVLLHYRVGEEGVYRVIKMKSTGEHESADGEVTVLGTYEGNIPSQVDQDNLKVYYYITGEDIRGLMVAGPLYGEGDPYSYRIDSSMGFTLFDAALAILMAVIFIVIVWGGFFKGVQVAVKADRRKAGLSY
jgi:hypothetical protein